MMKVQKGKKLPFPEADKTKDQESRNVLENGRSKKEGVI
jgi:hypothetical protein